MTREESFKNISAPRDVTSMRQQWVNGEKREWDPIDEAQHAFEEAGFPLALHDKAEFARLLRESAERVLGRPLTKPSPESSRTSPSSTEAEVEVEAPTDSRPEDGTKEQARTMPKMPSNEEAVAIIRRDLAALPGSPLDSPPSREAEIETPADSHSEDGTKKQGVQDGE